MGNHFAMHLSTYIDPYSVVLKSVGALSEIGMVYPILQAVKAVLDFPAFHLSCSQTLVLSDLSPSLVSEGPGCLHQQSYACIARR